MRSASCTLFRSSHPSGVGRLVRQPDRCHSEEPFDFAQGRPEATRNLHFVLRVTSKRRLLPQFILNEETCRSLAEFIPNKCRFLAALGMTR